MISNYFHEEIIYLTKVVKGSNLDEWVVSCIVYFGSTDSCGILSTTTHTNNIKTKF